MSITKELHTEIFKIPNLITLIRVLLLPFLYYSAYTGNTIVFLVLFLVAGLSDAFDGIVARALNQTSKFGAKFDCLADDLINFSVLIWLYLLLPEFVKQNFAVIIIALSFFGVFTLLELAIHKKRLAMHLYSHKFTNVLMYVFVLISVYYQPSRLFLFVLSFFITFAMIEGILIILFFKNIPNDTASIFSLVGRRK
ncbi:CDP-alcohol phosphatidyltransferase family protein [Candidatus Woesearchaeota archaeon]|nr:CDP-alcohol phosphatidyltransferase family protein [Candidatus Woesearchaeota archaeon]